MTFSQKAFEFAKTIFPVDNATMVYGVSMKAEELTIVKGETKKPFEVITIKTYVDAATGEQYRLGYGPKSKRLAIGTDDYRPSAY